MLARLLGLVYLIDFSARFSFIVCGDFYFLLLHVAANLDVKSDKHQDKPTTPQKYNNSNIRIQKTQKVAVCLDFFSFAPLAAG